MFGFQHSLRNAGGGGAEAEARSSISPLFNSRGSLRFSREVIMLHSQVGASLLRNPLFPGRFFLFFFFGEWWKAGVGCLSQVPTSPLSLSLSLFAIFIQLVPTTVRSARAARTRVAASPEASFLPSWLELVQPPKGKKKHN